MPLKKVEYRTPNRVRIDTGHKTFNSQCDLIMAGNVIGNAQLSFYIRPTSETECNGISFMPGQLFESDMKAFDGSIPAHLKRLIQNLGKKVILYEFRHWSRESGKNRKHVHGYVVTDPDNHLLGTTVIGSQMGRSARVVDTILPYVATRPINASAVFAL